MTPQPQDGNPQPRLFRLPSSQSVVNRYGFNSEGHLAVLERLQERIRTYIINNALLLPETTFPTPEVSANPDPDPIEAVLQNRSDASLIDSLNVPRSLFDGKVLAVNLGKNKISAPDAIDDFVVGVQTLGPYADALVVNVSSPNTPGLRSLQRREIIENLLADVVKARNELKLAHKPAVLLKIAPDLSRQEVADIGLAAQASKVDGIIVSNTTISRPSSAGNDPALSEQGGLSGPPLKPLSLRTLKTLYALTSGEIPLIGCGGISTGQDALEYAKAGATFVQLYTALGYQGVGLPRMIKNELAAALKAENKTWSQVVGSGIDLASINALGRESGPVGLLSLEEKSWDPLDKLKSEIESVLAGNKPSSDPTLLTREERLAAFLPEWNEFPSPAAALQGTTPDANAHPTQNAESGFMPDGCPQVVILDEVPKYTPAHAITKEEFQHKVDELKDLSEDVKHRMERTGEDLKEGAKVVGETFREAGKDLRRDLHVVEDVSRDAARQAGRAFAEVGREIRDESKEAAEWTKDVGRETWKETSAAAREFGRGVRGEARVVGEVAEDAWRQSKAAAREFRHDVKEESKEAAAWGKDAGREAWKETKDAAAWTKDVGEETWRQTKAASRELGHDIKEESKDAAAWSREHGREAWKETKDAAAWTRDVGAETLKQTEAASREIGHDIKEESRQAAGWTRDLGRETLRQTSAATRELAADLRKDVKATGALGETVWHDAKAAFRELGQDVRDESKVVGGVAQNAVQESTSAFGQAGRDIRDESRAAARWTRDVGRETVRETSAATRELGADLRKDVKTTGALGESVWHQAKTAFNELGREVRDESKEAASWTRDVGRETLRETRAATQELGQDIKDDAKAAGSASESIWQRAKAAFGEVGREVKEESKAAADVGRDAVRESTAAFSEAGREIRDESRTAGRVGKEATREAGQAFSELGQDVKQESVPIAEITKDAFRQAGEAFRELGHEIRHDPLLHKAQEGVDSARREARSVGAQPAGEGARYQDQTARPAPATPRAVPVGQGLGSLFSTFGERRNVTENSKKIV